MNLDDAQKKAVSAWIAEGLKLSEIQKRIASEFKLNLTYMDVRFLVDDLKLVPKDPPAPKLDKALLKPPPSAAAQPQSAAPAGNDHDAEDLAASASLPGTGGVSVSVDTMARPGALVSGNVTFSDGQTALWYLDQMGRMGIAPKKQGYKPSAADLQAFQQTLEAELSKIGF
jgi:hypothetical protein